MSMARRGVLRAGAVAGASAWLASHGVRAQARAAGSGATVPSPAGSTSRSAWAGSPAAPPVDPGAAARSQHFPFGPVVPPRPIAALPVVTQLGARTDLASLLRGRVTALQLMFTGCSATCPIQGALFAQAQRDLHLPASGPAAQFISISIDPLSDTPAALAAWLRQFSAQPGWSAVAPRVADLPALVAVLSAGGEPLPPTADDPHTGQVYVVDARGNLVDRLPSMPSPRSIVQTMEAVARRG